MNAVTLPKELEAWAEAEVAAGHAPSVEEVVVRALELRRAEIEWVRARLDEAHAELERGEGIDGDLFVAEIDSWIAEDLAKAGA